MVMVAVVVPLRPDCSTLHVPVRLGGLASAAATEVTAIATPPISTVTRRFIDRLVILSIVSPSRRSEELVTLSHDQLLLLSHALYGKAFARHRIFGRIV